MIRKFTILLGLIAILIPYTTFAGIHGILRGKVVDEEGKPLVGATVVVEGTGRGTNIKNKDGSFTIVNLTAGTYDVTVRYVGLETFKTRVTISADKTTEIIAKLKPSTKTGETLIVFGEKMVDKTTVGIERVINGGDIQRVATTNVSSFLALSAGVNLSGSGFSIRGGREQDTQIRVDGLDVGNQFTGGTGSTNTNYFPMVSAFATEEVTVLTGGFSAEYGNATGGVINTVMKTGKTDKYEGYATYQTDLASLNGRQKSGLNLFKEGQQLRVANEGEGYKRSAQGLNQIDIGIGGPLQILDKSTFYLTFLQRTEDFAGRSYDILDPIGNNIGNLPDNGSWVRNLEGRLKFKVSEDIDLTLGGKYGVTAIQGADWGWLYSNQPGIINGVSNGVPERLAKNIVANQFIYNMFAKINHRITETSFYEFKVSFTANNDQSGKRENFNDLGFFGAFDVVDPIDQRRTIENGTDTTLPDRVLDVYAPYLSNGLTADGFLRKNRQIRNPLTGYYEGQALVQSGNNAYGIVESGIFNKHGNESVLDYRWGNYIQVDGFYQTLFESSEFKHNVKAGFEFRMFNQQRHYNGFPYTGDLLVDIYTENFNGNIYADTQTEEGRKYRDLTSKAITPSSLAFWVVDQITYKDIIFTPSLRFESFTPSYRYRTLNTIEFVPITQYDNPQSFADASTKFMIAPRLNVTYPVTATSNITLNYGVFYKMPALQFLYDNVNTEILRPGFAVGDPNMNPEQTNTYQISYNNQVTDEIAFNTSIYYNDIFNQLGYQTVLSSPLPFSRTVVAEYGNNRGVELEVRKLDRDNFGFRLNYTVSYVNGTSTNPGSNVGAQTDPFTGFIAFPLAEYPLGRDIRQRLNYVLTLFLENGQGPELFGAHPLENTYITFSGQYRSGTPYTKTRAGSGIEIGPRNAERNPSLLTNNIRIAKSFNLKDIFGEDAQNSNIEFYLDINNFLNLNDYIAVFSATGNPDDNGVFLNRRIGDFGSQEYYKEARVEIPETYGASQYDDYGDRVYTEFSDFDKNGVLTQEEKYQAYVNYVQDALRFRGNYQGPRTVLFGLIFRF